MDAAGFHAGSGRANPVAAILTAALMLDNLGHAEAAAAIDTAVGDALRARAVTQDLGGDLGTAEVGDRHRRRGFHLVLLRIRVPGFVSC